MGYKVDDELTIVNFCSAVDTIANGYFDENGVFSPQYGILNAYCTFYNLCVVESPHDIEEITDKLSDIEILANDKEFLDEFFKAGENVIGLTFGHALFLADQKVHQRCTSVGSILDVFKNIGKTFSEVFTEDNMNMLNSLIAASGGENG